MAKIVIEIDDKTFGRIFHRDCIGQEHDYEVTRAIVNGTKLPDNATNGDVIKALFSNGSQVKGADIYIMDDNKSNVFYDLDWWNSLYKVGDTEESDAEFMCKAMSKTVNKSTDVRNFIGGF